MTERKSELDRLTDLAIDKFRRKLHLSTLELLVSDMIRVAGVIEVRRVLTSYLDALKDFDREEGP